MQKMILAAAAVLLFSSYACAHDMALENDIRRKDWDAVKTTIKALPEETLAQTKAKVMLFIYSRLVIEFLRGEDLFQRVADEPRHSRYAVDFYLRDLRYREQLVPHSLPYSQGFVSELKDRIDGLHTKMAQLALINTFAPPIAGRDYGKTTPAK